MSRQNESVIREIREKQAFICDMDGVIYHGSKLLDGAKKFIDFLKSNNKKFLFLTNSSQRTTQQYEQKMLDFGIEIEKQHFMTSALATATFIRSQTPHAKVFFIGDMGLEQALLDAGCTLTDRNPDYVVLGETKNYNFDKIQTAIRCVLAGAKLIGTNPDLTGPTENGIVPACKALIAPIELATGKNAYFIGKPNPLIMRHSLKILACRREDTVIIGDRMDTDIIAGIESEIQTVLVLSGITSMQDLSRFAYQPSVVLDNVGQIAE